MAFYIQVASLFLVALRRGTLFGGLKLQGQSFQYWIAMVSFTDITLFGLSNEESAVREMFVPCYLIEHQVSVWCGTLDSHQISQEQASSSMFQAQQCL